MQDDDLSDDPLLDDFKLLRRRVFQWQGQGSRSLAVHATCACLQGLAAAILASRSCAGICSMHSIPWPPAPGMGIHAALKGEISAAGSGQAATGVAACAYALGDCQGKQSMNDTRRAAVPCACRPDGGGAAGSTWRPSWRSSARRPAGPSGEQHVINHQL